LQKVIKEVCMRVCFVLLVGMLWSVSPVSAALFESRDAYLEKEEGQRGFGALFLGAENTSAAQWSAAQEELDQKKYRSAERLLQALYERWPNSLEAPEAVVAHAESLKKRKKWGDAFTVYQYAIDNYANRLKAYSDVLNGQFELAVEVMEQRRMRFIFGGYQMPEMAIPYFEAVILNGPQWERAPEAMMMVGECNQKSDAYEEAISAYFELTLRYPNHVLAEEAAWRRIECLQALREEYPVSPSVLNRILTATTLYLSTYPNTERRGAIVLLRNELYEFQAEQVLDQGRFYEQVAKNPLAALHTYESLLELYPKSEHVEAAQARVDALHELGVRSEAEEASE
jgi:outer membrane protein assembly factor BamD (BamD/ComL family)